MKTAFIYALLAIVAMFANIAMQDLLVRVYTGQLAICFAVVAGTGVGLVVKYVLDKRYIFNIRDRLHDGKTFGLYALTGLLTTMIFWGLEYGFDHLFETREMRYVGGLLGLTIGYVGKYFLDKKYVFRGASS